MGSSLSEMDSYAMLRLATLARTALVDPAALPEGELDAYVEEAETLDAVFGEAALPPNHSYAVDLLHEVLAQLDTR
jgi:hypothetical protein